MPAGKLTKFQQRFREKLLALDSQLTNDFSEKNSYFQSQVDKIRKEAYAGVVAGPFGLIISYSIAAGVVEGKLIFRIEEQVKICAEFLYHPVKHG
ncbi:hemolysin E [Escherichia coli]